MLNILDTYKKLQAVRSASGHEEAVMDVIASIAAPYADEIKRDALGNLIVLRKGDVEGAKKVMLSAHADEIGLVISSVEENGFLRFCAVGGISPVSVIGSSFIFENGVCGVVSGEKGKDSELSDCYMDIGASSAEEALSMVSIGDVAGYANIPFETNGILFSPYLDDKICCAVMLAALSIAGRKNDLYFTFSVQEEVGCRGAMTAAYGIAPDIGLVLDVTPATDTLPVKKRTLVKMGGGPSNKIMDATLVCSPKLRALIDTLAAENNIPIQHDVLSRGGTDGGNMQRARAGAEVGGISVVTRYVHSPFEAVSLKDCDDAAKLTALFADCKF